MMFFWVALIGLTLTTGTLMFLPVIIVWHGAYKERLAGKV